VKVNSKHYAMKSKFFTLDWKDLLRGLLIAFLTAILTGVINILDTGAVFLPG